MTTTALARLILRATTDGGWALLTDNGAVVFRRAGAGARRACLVFARDHGVLSIVT